MNETLFEKFCKVGQEADALFNQGRYREAHTGYVRLLREIETSRLADSYLISKITLGLLMTHIKLGEYSKAFAIWNAEIEASLFGIGIYGLEHAQTSVHDMMCYDFVCAFLHSLSDGDKREAAKAVNLYMSRVCEHLTEEGDKKSMRMAISNWKQHLKEIFGSSLPHVAANPLIDAERLLGGDPVPLQGIGFPPPSIWQKPEGFREVSRLINFRPLAFNGGMEDGAAARKIKK